MSSTKAFRSKKTKPKKRTSDPQGSQLLSPVGLQPGEIGIIPDPEDLTRVHSYMFADGTQIRLDNSSVPARIPPLEPSLMVTSPEATGLRNTLAYRFGEMMTIAQNLFGERDLLYLFLGFEFVHDHGRARFVSDTCLSIQLSFRAMTNPMEAYFELAHECIHLLSPDPHKPATILEEGMATVFAIIYMRDTMKVKALTSRQEAYEEAGALVAMLMKIDPYGIKKIREEQPAIRKIDKTLILKYYPTVPEEVAARLARTFLAGDPKVDRPRTIGQYNRENSDVDKKESC